MVFGALSPRRITVAACAAFLAVLPTNMAAAAQAVAAPTTADAARERGTRLVLLGTQGGPNIRKFRSQPASLVVVDGQPYLFDSGDGVSRQLKLAGYDPADITRIFLTHLHFDHVAGLASLLGFGWTKQTSHPFEIYGPPGTAEFVKGAVGYMAIPITLYAAVLPPRPTLSEIVHVHDFDVAQPKVIFQDNRIKVTAVENSHYSTMKNPLSFPNRSYAYRVDTKDRSIVFTGDTGPSDAIVALAKGADILVSEVLDVDQTIKDLAVVYKRSIAEMRPLEAHMRREHLSPEEVGKLASRAGVKTVVLSHIAMGEDGESDFSHYVNGIKAHFSGAVVVGKDLDQF
jgi:ribonuclease BN (tRNA processing enzyme)